MIISHPILFPFAILISSPLNLRNDRYDITLNYIEQSLYEITKNGFSYPVMGKPERNQCS